CTLGRLASAASVSASALREFPPARSISPAARPSGSSSSTFSRCSGANCWWPSRSASDWADWTKPRARSVYFSKFIRTSLLACTERPEQRDRNIFYGDTRPALTGVNRRAEKPADPSGIRPKDVGGNRIPGKRWSAEFVRDRFATINVRRPGSGRGWRAQAIEHTDFYRP